jgi:hypothetical protein
MGVLQFTPCSQSFTNALKRAGIDTPKGQNTCENSLFFIIEFSTLEWCGFLGLALGLLLWRCLGRLWFYLEY